MLSVLGPLSFATPAALVALALLPALWWLLRVIPPSPRRVRFPPLRLIAALAAREESVERTPPWLLVLRLLLALALILAAAGPLLNAAPPLPGSGPVILVIDDGWAAAHGWTERRRTAGEVLERAARDGRRVVVATTAATAETPEPEPLAPTTAADAREHLRALAPRPWQSDRAAAVRRISGIAALRDAPPGAVVWLADGFDEPAGERRFGDLAQALRPYGSVAVVAPEAAATALLLHPPEYTGRELRVSVTLAAPAPADRDLMLSGSGEDGAVLLREAVRIAAGAERATATLAPPAELVNRLTRLAIEGQETAGAVVLLDERWRRRPVGIVSEGTGDLPLLSDAFYLERALQPFADVRRGSLETLLRREMAVLVLPDGGVPAGPARDRLVAWVEDGGVLLRFAGPRLAAGADREDPLLPVTLRVGERTMGGALAWREPARLAPFDPAGPFAGLAVPDDVAVLRQVLAEPSLDLESRTLARLDDGTPLVTAADRGDGRVILIHTTPNPEWSNLALSGLYVDMLERIVRTGRGVAAAADGGPLAPVRTLDAFGVLGPPPPGTRAIAADGFDDVALGPRHPPGIYGRAGEARAVNLSSRIEAPQPLGPLPAGVERQTAAAAQETDLVPWLLTAALLLALVDLAVSLSLRGLLTWPRAAAAGLAVAVAAAPGVGAAQVVIADGTAPPQSLETRLAYVLTGDTVIDDASFTGLRGLSAVVGRRTSVELGTPIGVRPEEEELAFYPLLYWPVAADAAAPSPPAIAAVRRFMANGGTVLFDTRDAGRGSPSDAVRQLARALEIPPLVAVPRDHVLGRAYYLLEDFPGRFTGGAVWVEPTTDRAFDGVSPVIAGGHDWAGAWAVDDVGRPLYPVVPGGEGQRELAYRFGINLVMYVLAGSYKADQVHLPAIMERLGQ